MRISLSMLDTIREQIIWGCFEKGCVGIGGQVRDFTVDDRNPSTVNRQTVRWSGGSGRVVWRVWQGGLGGSGSRPMYSELPDRKKLVHI